MATDQILLVIAIVLFVLDSLFWWVATAEPYRSRLTPLGLAFFAASFLFA